MDSSPAVQPTAKVLLIKTLYLYLVSFVALMMIVISAVDAIGIVLKTFIFTKADRSYYSPVVNCESSKPVPPVDVGSAPTPAAPATSADDCRKQAEEQKKIDNDNRASTRQQDLVRDISLLLVGMPLFVGHWRLARRKE